MIEDVHLVDGLFTALFEPIDKIDPARHGFGDVFRLHCLPEHGHKIVRVGIGPFRQHHIINPLLILRPPKIVVIDVDKQLRQHIEVRDELSYITRGGCGVVPGVLVVGEHPIGDIEFTALEGHGAVGVGLEADEEVADNG